MYHTMYEQSLGKFFAQNCYSTWYQILAIRTGINTHKQKSRTVIRAYLTRRVLVLVPVLVPVNPLRPTKFLDPRKRCTILARMRSIRCSQFRRNQVRSWDCNINRKSFWPWRSCSSLSYHGCYQATSLRRLMQERRIKLSLQFRS